jgi:hypothetical protein
MYLPSGCLAMVIRVTRHAQTPKTRDQEEEEEEDLPQVLN